MKDREWMEQAACKAHPYLTWFPTTDGRKDVEYTGRSAAQAKAAIKVCESCPVREQCLAYGLKEEDGIYGGKTPRERRRIVRLTRQSRPPQPRPQRRCKGCDQWFTPTRQSFATCSRECYYRSRLEWASPLWASSRREAQ